jgi:hypothetical protein
MRQLGPDRPLRPFDHERRRYRFVKSVHVTRPFDADSSTLIGERRGIGSPVRLAGSVVLRR